MPAITVVMPVYNTKEYVGRAIESIINQTFQDYEFLIIDNGSEDGSGEIIRNYAIQDSRIKMIVNKKNVFIAEARNAAIKIAKGDYLYLIDSDDWAEADMLEKMYNKAQKYHAQYVVAGYYMEYYQQGKSSTYKVCPDERFYLQKEFRKNAVKYLTRTLLTVPWNKLYSLSYLREHDIKFRNTKLEDHHFNMDIIMDVERVYMIHEPFYHYFRSRQGTDSQIVYNKYLNQKKRDHFEHTLAVYDHWNIKDKKTMTQLYNYHAGRMVECVEETVTNKSLNAEERKSELNKILYDKLTVLAVKNAHPDSIKMKLLQLPIKWKIRWLCYFEGYGIWIMKTKFSYMFYRMRAKEAQKAE